MIIKKSNIFLSTYTAIHSFSPTASVSSASSRSLSTRDSRCHSRRQETPRRQYATIASEPPSSEQHEYHWPDPPQGHHCPTPYQIFAIRPNAPYHKTRFYELVKLYHPDRKHHSDTLCPPDCSHATKLERYRLIVAAHTILSDPAKRSAYDRFGAGWAGKTSSTATSAYTSAHGSPGPFSSSWRGENPDIWSNATWEDWERFHARHDPFHPFHKNSQQGPLYLSNTYFVTLVLCLAVLGSTWNFNRADNAGASFLAARDEVHDRAAKELRKVRQETGARAKDERIQWFVRNREASLMGVGVEEIREEKARALLGENGGGPENCMAEELRTRE